MAFNLRKVAKTNPSRVTRSVRVAQKKLVRLRLGFAVDGISINEVPFELPNGWTVRGFTRALRRAHHKGQWHGILTHKTH